MDPSQQPDAPQISNSIFGGDAFSSQPQPSAPNASETPAEAGASSKTTTGGPQLTEQQQSYL